MTIVTVGLDIAKLSQTHRLFGPGRLTAGLRPLPINLFQNLPSRTGPVSEQQRSQPIILFATE
jgi:hypothetical protein